MNAATIGILKEVRVIFWTWIAVVALTLLSGVGSSSYPLLNFAGGMGLLVGIPLLAVLPLGSELEDGTLSLLLSQSITRLQIWLRKFTISAVAVGTASAAYVLVWRSELFPRFPILLALWVLVALCSGPYCALIARSVRGGLALDIISVTVLFMWSQLSLWPQSTAVLILWAGLMLALGIRQMTRLQLTSSFVGGDLLTVAPRIRVFRCQPVGAVANFIRKELGLLRPLWVITVAFLIIWTPLAIWDRSSSLTPRRTVLAL